MEPERKSGFVARLWRVVGGLLLLLALLVGQSILASRRLHEEQAQLQTSSVARVLESTLGGLFDKVKLALHTVASERERQLRGGPVDDVATRAYIASILANVRDVVAIRVADASGRVTIQGEFADGPAEGVETQPYFQRLRDARLAGVVISPPHRDGPAGQWVIDIAQRVEAPDGRFAGAVIAPVPVERLERMLAAADAGRDGAVSLRGEGLAIIARHPPPADRNAAAGAPEALRTLVAKGEASGTFLAPSPIDGIERVHAYRKVADYPLHVTVAMSTAEYLAHWRRDMGIAALLASVLFAVTIGASIAVDRAWRRQRQVTLLLEEQAHTDVLTGLSNRRRFFEMAEAELTRARRYATALSLLMLDIDHFKAVNDMHGHKAGDRVLQQLARTCREVMRAVDIVGRVGGEEFAILLPETELTGAVEVAERLRQAVAGASVAREEGVPLRITVSIGVATLEPDANLDTMMSQSDTALYQAKHEGRNRVRAYSRPE